VDSFRTFIAIELPADVRARVAQHIAFLRHELPDVRAGWSREDNLHLTLKFLGDVPIADIPTVSDAVASATKSVSSFELTFFDSGTFPPQAGQAFSGLVRRPPACKPCTRLSRKNLPKPGSHASRVRFGRISRSRVFVNLKAHVSWLNFIKVWGSHRSSSMYQRLLFSRVNF